MDRIEDPQPITDIAQRLTADFAGRLDGARVEAIVRDSAEVLASRGLTSGGVLEQYSTDRVRAILREEAGAANRPSILFLCVHNAGRSQMAAGWTRRLGGEGVEVFGGGSEPGDQVNPSAVAVMAERGIDISGVLPQPWSDEVVRAMDVVVTMGCGDECPYYPGTRYVDWELDDPAGKSVDDVRPVRDEIERRVRALLAELGVEAGTD